MATVLSNFTRAGLLSDLHDGALDRNGGVFVVFHDILRSLSVLSRC